MDEPSQTSILATPDHEIEISHTECGIESLNGNKDEQRDWRDLGRRLDVLEGALRLRRRSCSTCSVIGLPSDEEKDTRQERKAAKTIRLDADPRILYVESRWDTTKGVYVDRPGIPSQLTEQHPEPDADHGIIWKQKSRRRPAYHGIEATVLNEDLKKLLAEHLKHYPGHWDEEVTIQNPFEALIHNWKKLKTLSEEICTDPRDQLARKDLQSLLREVGKTRECKEYVKTLDQIENDKIISFRLLWTIFSPGTLVFSTPYDRRQAFLVSSAFYDPPLDWTPTWRGPRPISDFESDSDSDIRRSFVLNCWSYDFDGDKFRRLPYKLSVGEYSGTKKVTALSCYPLDLHAEAEIVRNDLIERGELFRSYNTKEEGHQTFDHKGKIYRRKAASFDDVNEDRILVRSRYSLMSAPDEFKQLARFMSLVEHNGRVVVDVKSFRKYGPTLFKWQFERSSLDWDQAECGCLKCQANPILMDTFKTAYDGVKKDANGKWPKFDDTQRLLCPPRVLGFALDEKVWVQMLVRNVHEIEEGPDENAFGDLVLPDDGEPDSTKSLIENLVKYHITARSKGATWSVGSLKDFVDKKGQGLVILLHGTSGTGKTLTVECVTKMTGKPLLKISVADIGIQVAYVEEKLRSYFELAQAWDAVLLIDEADILLESRSQDHASLERNAMVAVFLKILEYYEGILLLTTNRVKSIDIAVESRVNVAVYYAPMSLKDQRKLFKKFLDRLEDKDIDDKKDLIEWIDLYFKEEFNGRDIRNMLSSALAIARAKKEKLKRRHIEVVRDSKKSSQKTFAELRTIARAERGFD